MAKHNLLILKVFAYFMAQPYYVQDIFGLRILFSPKFLSITHARKNERSGEMNQLCVLSHLRPLNMMKNRARHLHFYIFTHTKV